MAIFVDDSLWPVVVMRIVGTMTETDIDAHFDLTTPSLCSRGRFASVIDGREAELPRFDAAVRHRLSAGLRKVRPMLLGNLMCECYVIDSGMARGIITAVWWVAPPAWPASVTASVGEAMRWTETQIALAQSSS